HAIVGDFEAGFQYRAMLGRILVENGVGIVNVNQDFAAVSVGRELRQQAVGPGKRGVADFAGGFAAAAGAAEVVVGPESAVDQNHIGRHGQFLPFRVVAGERGSEEHFFAFGLEEKADRRVIG